MSNQAHLISSVSGVAMSRKCPFNVHTEEDQKLGRGQATQHLAQGQNAHDFTAVPPHCLHKLLTSLPVWVEQQHLLMATPTSCFPLAIDPSGVVCLINCHGLTFDLPKQLPGVKGHTGKGPAHLPDIFEAQTVYATPHWKQSNLTQRTAAHSL